MDFQTKIILGLAVVDSVIIAFFYLWLRSIPPMDERTLSASRTGLFMFVLHALFCFKGAFLILQLATIAAGFALCHLQQMGKNLEGHCRCVEVAALSWPTRRARPGGAERDDPTTQEGRSDRDLTG